MNDSTNLITRDLIADIADLLTHRRNRSKRMSAEVDSSEAAYRDAIRAHGECLFEVGGLPAMQAGWNAVARRHGGKGLSICNSTWDGIGRTVTRPGWVA